MDVSEMAVYLFTKYPGMKSSILVWYQDMGKSLVKAFPCLSFPGKRPRLGLLLFEGINMNKRENAMHRITVKHVKYQYTPKFGLIIFLSYNKECKCTINYLIVTIRNNNSFIGTQTVYM